MFYVLVERVQVVPDGALEQRWILRNDRDRRPQIDQTQLGDVEVVDFDGSAVELSHPHQSGD